MKLTKTTMITILTTTTLNNAVDLILTANINNIKKQLKKNFPK